MRMSLFSGRCLSLYGILAMGKYILCKVLLYALIFDTFCIGVSILNILSLSLHKIGFGSVKSTPVKHRFPFLPLHSPFAIFTDRMMGTVMVWTGIIPVTSSFPDVFQIILFVAVLA